MERVFERVKATPSYVHSLIQNAFTNLYSRNMLDMFFFFSTRIEFLREILCKNIAIIAIQHDKFILLTPLAIFPILLGETHSIPSGKFPYTY